MNFFLKLFLQCSIIVFLSAPRISLASYSYFHHKDFTLKIVALDEIQKKNPVYYHLKKRKKNLFMEKCTNKKCQLASPIQNLNWKNLSTWPLLQQGSKNLLIKNSFILWSLISFMIAGLFFASSFLTIFSIFFISTLISSGLIVPFFFMANITVLTTISYFFVPQIINSFISDYEIKKSSIQSFKSFLKNGSALYIFPVPLKSMQNFHVFAVSQHQTFFENVNKSLKML